MKLTKILENTINDELDLNEASVDSTGAIKLFPKSLILKFKNANKLNKFNDYLNTLPGGDALEKVADGITKICANKDNETKLVEIFKSKSKLENLTSINPLEGINGLLYKVRPSGTGPGEVLISWYINGAMFQGGNVSYDIDYNGQHWEVKSLITNKGNTPATIDPANYGKLANHPFSQDIQMFFSKIIEPYYTNKLRASILALSEDNAVKQKLNDILTIIESMPSTTASGKTQLSKTIGEMTPMLFNKFYESIKQIHDKIPKSVKDTAKSSRITVKSSTTDAQYWMEPEDVNDITKSAGKDKEISIKVGTKITDENKEAKIWLSNLLNNVFIKNPDYFVDSLRAIRDGFAQGKQGLIYLTTDGFNLSKGMEKFFTSHITRTTYRFALKDRFPNYEYAREQ